MRDEQGSVLIVGVGGQGVVLASAVVADVALATGYDVKQSEVHGMSQRGGVVSSHLRFGPRVQSPLIEVGQADAVVAFEWNEGLRALPYLRPGAPLIVNLQRLVPPGACSDRREGRSGYPVLPVEALAQQVADLRACDALAIASQAGSPRALNSVLLGVLAPLLPFPDAAWRQALEGKVPPGTFPVNERALLAGRALRFPDETYRLAASETVSGNGHRGSGIRAPRLEVHQAWCKGKSCEICVRACPEYCLAMDDVDRLEVVRAETCTGCRLCELLCPDFAIVVRETRAKVQA